MGRIVITEFMSLDGDIVVHGSARLAQALIDQDGVAILTYRPAA